MKRKDQSSVFQVVPFSYFQHPSYLAVSPFLKQMMRKVARLIVIVT